MRRLARLALEAERRLAMAEVAVEAVGRDVEARVALVSEIEVLDGEIEEIARVRRETMEKSRENIFGEVALRELDARRAEKEACRAIAAARLGSLREVELDARLEEREALALSTRELLRARAKKAMTDFDVAASRLLLNEWVRAIVESWFEVIQSGLAREQMTSFS
jgi:hypothetical protein